MKNSAPLGLPPPTHDPLRSPLKAEGFSAVSAAHTYHLCGSISSAALREKSDVSAGKGFMLFHKKCSTSFSKRQEHYSAVGSLFSSWIIFQRLDHLLWKGMKPFPALGMRHPISPNLDDDTCTLVLPDLLGFLRRNMMQR